MIKENASLIDKINKKFNEKQMIEMSKKIMYPLKKLKLKI